MSRLLHNTVWPVPDGVRPRERRPVVTARDIDPRLLARYPGIVDELNSCLLEIWRGEGEPGRGWQGWSYAVIPLEAAVDLPCAGEA